VSSSVVAVIDWRAASALQENARFLERAQAADRVRPREWRAGSSVWRSLIIRGDGGCEFQRWSVAAVARRCGGRIAGRAAGKTRSGERG
jgi:hypothetical protein